MYKSKPKGNVTRTRHETHAVQRKISLLDKNSDLNGLLSCAKTLFQCLRQNHLSLRQVPMMSRHKPDLLLFKTTAETGDLLGYSKK